MTTRNHTRVLQGVRVEHTPANPAIGITEVYMGIPFYTDGSTDGAEGEWCELIDRATFAVRWYDPEGVAEEISAPPCGPIVVAVLRAFVEAHGQRKGRAA